eukprot:scaffold27790_cov70-Phaeocystis_antarctica.AAC.4
MSPATRQASSHRRRSERHRGPPPDRRSTRACAPLHHAGLRRACRLPARRGRSHEIRRPARLLDLSFGAFCPSLAADATAAATAVADTAAAVAAAAVSAAAAAITAAALAAAAVTVAALTAANAAGAGEHRLRGHVSGPRRQLPQGNDHTLPGRRVQQLGP